MISEVNDAEDVKDVDDGEISIKPKLFKLSFI